MMESYDVVVTRNVVLNVFPFALVGSTQATRGSLSI
jgi:hypothetical protein